MRTAYRLALAPLFAAMLQTACADHAQPGPDAIATQRFRPEATEASKHPLAGDSVKKAPARKRIHPPLSIEINLPAGRLDLYKGGEFRKSYRVSVGYAPYYTPVGTHYMRRVVWNPWWTPPESDWARKRKKTAPGPRNPMGRVKLHLTEMIYIHGTTAGDKLGRPASHGCIRMSNADALELARLVAENTEALPSDTVAALEKSVGKTREVDLPWEIPVRVRYRRAEIRNDTLIVHRDIYGRAANATAAARKAWAEAGKDPALLTPEILAHAIALGQPVRRPAPTDTSARVAKPVAAPVLLGIPVVQPVDSTGS